MVEVALAQVEARCTRRGQYHIAGYYHANRSMKDATQVRCINFNGQQNKKLIIKSSKLPMNY